MTPREAPPEVNGAVGTESVDLSVIVVNRNTRDLLRACLESMGNLPDVLRFEVIVVDNASTDGSIELVEQSFPDVRLIRNAENTGFARPNNQGMRASRGRYVMLLNSDTEVGPYAFDRLVAFMEAHPNAGACGPLLRYPDGRPQPSWLSFHSPWRVFCEMAGLGALFPRNPLFANQERLFDPSATAQVETLMGAALVVRREVINTVGMLDERFTIHANETDWCFRMAGLGWRRYFVPGAEVVHHLGGTLRQENERFRLQAEMVSNLFDYYRKHYGTAGLLWFRFWTVLGFAGRGLLASWRRPRAPADDRAEHFRKKCWMMVRAGVLGPRWVVPGRRGDGPVVAPLGSSSRHGSA